MTETKSWKEQDPIGTLQGLSILLDDPRVREEIARAAEPGVKVDSIFAQARAAVVRDPTLLRGTNGSMFSALVQAAKANLEFSGLTGLAYLGKRRVKDREAKREWIEIRFLLGYRGMAEMARRGNPDIANIEGDVIMEGEFVEHVRGLEPRFTHKPAIDRPAPTAENCLAAYVIITYHRATPRIVMMGRKEIEELRQKSQAPDGTMWGERWAEAAKKTVLRNALKWEPVSERTAEVIRGQDEMEFPQYAAGAEEPKGRAPFGRFSPRGASSAGQGGPSAARTGENTGTTGPDAGEADLDAALGAPEGPGEEIPEEGPLPDDLARFKKAHPDAWDALLSELVVTESEIRSGDLTVKQLTAIREGIAAAMTVGRGRGRA